MRLAALLLLSVAAFPMSATTRAWEPALLSYISSETNDGGIAVLPIGTMIAGVPIRSVRNCYRFETAAKTYVGCTINKKPLNVTLHGQTQIAADGGKLYIRDDDGKERKLQLVQKVAKDTPKP